MSAGTLRNGTAAVAARDAYRASVAAGEPLSGAELARRYDRSPSWGQGIVAAERTAIDAERQAVPVESLAPPEAQPAPPGAELAPAPAAPDDRQRRPWYDTAVTLVVALVAAAASYGHMIDVALMAGEPLRIARAWPVTVDGLVVALRRGERGRPWLALGLAVSVGANVLAQFPDWAASAGPVVSAWPPLALYGTHRLLSGPRT
jgi:hypothetical protein